MKNIRIILISALASFAAAITLASLLFFSSYRPIVNNTQVSEQNKAEQVKQEEVIASEEVIEDRIFISPYEAVNWDVVKLYSANFHTHTNLSDGLSSPEEVVNAYIDNNYQILSITDHDNLTEYKTTWPWSEAGVEKEVENKILALEGNEITEVDNIVSLFSDYGGDVLSEDEALKEIKNKNGLAIMAHPGRYTKPLNFYIDLYSDNSNLIGLEVFNQNDRYPSDRDLWDRILNENMPQKSIWGFANDDMHNIAAHLGFNRNIFPLKNLSLENLRESVEGGSFFFWFAKIQKEAPDFYIKSIINTGENIEIKIEGTYSEIKWLGFNPKTNSTEIVESSLSINTSSLPKDMKFVRFVISSDSGDLYSQPFKVMKK